MEEPGSARQQAAATRQQFQHLANTLQTTSVLLENALTGNNNKRRPELPTWDPKNTEAWIRRTNNAFTRAGINTAKEKFAFLESVMPVELHPTINTYFSGDPTEDNYAEMIDFVRQRYGRTREQQVHTAIRGVRRQGHLPSDLAATLEDQFGHATIEDVKKAHLLAALPETVRSRLTERVHDMTLPEIAKAADKYFHRDGTIRRNAASATINAIPPDTHPKPKPRENDFTPAFSDKDTERRQTGICWYHGKFGSLAKTCQKPCTFRKTTSHTASGNERGGRRQ